MIKEYEVPSQKQIAYAKSLGISNPESYTKKALSELIDKAKKERQKKKEEEKRKVATATLEEKEIETEVESISYPLPLPASLNVEAEVEITISFSTLNEMKRVALEEAKIGRKKYVKNYNSLISLLKSLEKKGILEKDTKNRVVRIVANRHPIYCFAYLQTLMEIHFVEYQWNYI